MLNSFFWIISLFNRNRKYRLFTLLFLDFLFIGISIFSSLLLSNEIQNLIEFFSKYNINFYVTSTIGISIYLYTGQYKAITSTLGSRSLYLLSIRNFIIVILSIIITSILKLELLELRTSILLFLILNILVGTSRFVFRDLLTILKNPKKNKKITLAIYGAGSFGSMVLSTLRTSSIYDVKVFIDDSSNLWGRFINNIPIFSPKYLIEKRNNIDQVLLAIPSLKKYKVLEIIKSLKQIPIPVYQVPSFEEIVSGYAKIDQLKEFSIDDLLGRDIVIPDEKLLGSAIENKNICITGGGGSIGSEICRQILTLNPRKIVILENCEYNLFKISKDLRIGLKSNIKIKSILGTTLNKDLVSQIFLNEKIDLVFHAAAYKHVPLVEENPISGIENNVVSTINVCKASQNSSVKHMVLISTDKAVRPKSVMGASKRVAELVVQKFSAEQDISNFENFTKYTTVRFGNVLGSSGSVVPLFRKQISGGGPVTLTHQEVARYFMTIPEAAQLVIQSTVLAEGGETFLLDMGSPIKIKDLAEQMITLSGLTIKNKDNPDGDIKIITTGLRPGEKLIEELLVDGESLPTTHPLIFKSQEKKLDLNSIDNIIRVLDGEIDLKNKDKVVDTFAKILNNFKNY